MQARARQQRGRHCGRPRAASLRLAAMLQCSSSCGARGRPQHAALHCCTAAAAADDITQRKGAPDFCCTTQKYLWLARLPKPAPRRLLLLIARAARNRRGRARSVASSSFHSLPARRVAVASGASVAAMPPPGKFASKIRNFDWFRKVPRYAAACRREAAAPALQPLLTCLMPLRATHAATCLKRRCLAPSFRYAPCSSWSSSSSWCGAASCWPALLQAPGF